MTKMPKVLRRCFRPVKNAINFHPLCLTFFILCCLAILIVLTNVVVLGSHSFQQKLANGHFVDFFLPWRTSYDMTPDFEFLEASAKGKCVIPKIDPFREEAVRFMEHLPDLHCSRSQSPFGWVKDSKLFIRTDGMVNGYMQYIERPSENDFNFKLTEKVPLVKPANGDIIIEPSKDFVKLVINNGTYQNTEYHAFVVPKKELLNGQHNTKSELKGMGLNVAFIVFDSQSSANFERTMPKTLKYLRGQSGNVQLKHHAVVGDGTTPQLCAILTGLNEHHLPDARMENKESKTVDGWPFLFKTFKQQGYVTMFLEDQAEFAAFSNHLRGFRHSPTDHYARPFFLATSKTFERSFCVGPKAVHKHGLDYTMEFYEKYRGFPKFSISVIASVSHNSLNNMQLIDNDLYQFLISFETKGQRNNTLLIILGDHGPRISQFRASISGKLEESLPFASVLVPKWFPQKHKDLYEALTYNSDILTSHFDFYPTLKHTLSYPSLPKSIKTGQSLFTKLDPETRTCKSAGIPDHFCPCLQYKEMSVKDPEVQTLARLSVQYINGLISVSSRTKELCYNLKLLNVKRAGKRKPNWKVQHFSFSRWNSRCPTCALVFDKKLADTSSQQYEIILSVHPSGAIFEVTVTVCQGKSQVDSNISRLNKYGNQPACIAKEFPSLRPYCYCKNLKIKSSNEETR